MRDGLCLGTKHSPEGAIMGRLTNGIWQEKQILNSRFGLLVDTPYVSPAVYSMLVVQPDSSRHEIGWFTYAPKPLAGVRRQR